MAQRRCRDLTQFPRPPPTEPPSRPLSEEEERLRRENLSTVPALLSRSVQQTSIATTEEGGQDFQAV